MKETFCQLSKSLQKQVLIRFMGGGGFLFLLLMILICFRDLYFALPCFLLAGFLLISGAHLFYNGSRGEYICIHGICEQIETFGIRKRIKAIRIAFDGYSLRIPVRQRMRRLSVGDTVIIYLSQKAPVYEQDGEYMVCSYYALETEKGCEQIGSK